MNTDRILAAEEWERVLGDTIGRDEERSARRADARSALAAHDAALRSRVTELTAVIPSLISFALAAPTNAPSVDARDDVVARARALLGEPTR